MILDSYSLTALVFQIQYADCFELWDRAGSVARGLLDIWPDVKLIEGQPQQQTLRGEKVEIQTGFRQSTITLRGIKTLDQRTVKQLSETFEVWRERLGLRSLSRVSARACYAKKFDDLGAANQHLRDLGLVRWPKQRVFDMSDAPAVGGFDLTYRFDDSSQFSTVRVRSETVKYEATLDADFVETPNISKTFYRAAIDFDRGALGSVDAVKLRIEDWFKGYLHVMRRDIDKVVLANHD